MWFLVFSFCTRCSNYCAVPRFQISEHILLNLLGFFFVLLSLNLVQMSFIQDFYVFQVVEHVENSLHNINDELELHHQTYLLDLDSDS